MRRTLSEASQGLDGYSRRLLSPSAQIRHQRVKLLSMAAALTHAVRTPVNRQNLVLAQLQQRWMRHRPDMRAMRAQLLADGRHLNTSLCNAVKRRRDALDALAAQLELLNPQRTLERGYAIVRNVKGEVLRDPAQVKARNKLSLRLAGGTADIVVSSVQAALGDSND